MGENDLMTYLAPVGTTNLASWCRPRPDRSWHLLSQRGRPPWGSPCPAKAPHTIAAD